MCPPGPAWPSPDPSGPTGPSRGLRAAAARGAPRPRPAAGPPPAAGASPAAPVVSRIVADPAAAAAQPVRPDLRGRVGRHRRRRHHGNPHRPARGRGGPGGAVRRQGHSDTELDELARALFGRFRTHLRAEVIHEREAKGLTFDAF